MRPKKYPIFCGVVLVVFIYISAAHLQLHVELVADLRLGQKCWCQYNFCETT